MTESAMAVQHGGTHYKGMGIQPFEMTLANGYDGAIHSVLKYVSRHALKGGAEDLLKGEHITMIRAEMLTKYPASELFARTVITPDQYCEANGIEGVARKIICDLHDWATSRFRKPVPHFDIARPIVADIAHLRAQIYGEDG